MPLRAREIFSKLSPGSPFYRSECGLHVAYESVGVSIDDRLRYVSIAYFTTSDGRRSHAIVHHKLFSRPIAFDPVTIREWEQPVPSSYFYPPELAPALALVCDFTRQWVQGQTENGWMPPKPSLPEGTPIYPAA